MSLYNDMFKDCADNLTEAFEALENMQSFLIKIEGHLQEHDLWGDEEQDLLEANERILSKVKEVKI